MSPVFRHGSLRLYLLRLLDEEPRHGYEVIRLLRDRFMGVYSPSPGTIYPRLARLEEEGLVTHDEVDGRKVYRLGLQVNLAQADAGNIQQIVYQAAQLLDLALDKGVSPLKVRVGWALEAEHLHGIEDRGKRVS